MCVVRYGVCLFAGEAAGEMGGSARYSSADLRGRVHSTAPAARALSERVLNAALMSGTYLGISTLIQNRRGLLKKLERPAFDSVKPL